MKKLTVSILAVLYLGLSIGAPVQMHYCMEKLVSKGLWYSSKSEKCSICGMAKDAKKSCCKDEHKLFKIHDNQEVSYADFSFNTPLKYWAVSHRFLSVQPIAETNSDDFLNDSHSSPPYYEREIYIRNCVFRI